MCINFDDAYKHSPAWNMDVMCTNTDGSPQVYMYWAGGLAYFMCPYKDVQTGNAFKRIDTMLDFGTAGSCYIDVLSATLDKHSEGPGGAIDWMDNLVAGKFKIAEYYWTHGVKLYSEHCTYPFVGHILGGLNNRNTGLSADKNVIPMPSFILHGKMNNFFGSTAFGRAGRMLLGIVPNIDGNVFSPVDKQLDEIFLSALPARTFVGRAMTNFAYDGKQFQADYAGNTHVMTDAQGKGLQVVVDGRSIVQDETCFVPRAKGGYWAYATATKVMGYSLPAGWDPAKIRVFALNRDGRHEEVHGVARVLDAGAAAGADKPVPPRVLELRMFARVPYLVTDGQDLVPVGSEDYGRFERNVEWGAVVSQVAKPALAGRVQVDGTTVALPEAGSAKYTAAVKTADGVWVARRTNKDFAAYRDKRVRPKDHLLLLGPDGQVAKDVTVLGPVNDLAYDAVRKHLIVSMGAYNYDGVQFVDPQAGKVVGLVPLVSEAWGEDLRLCVSGDVLYVAAPTMQNVAAIRLNVPWPAEAAGWCGRIFDKAQDPRDPEAALDEFLRVRWDRLRDFHAVGFPIADIQPAEGGGFAVSSALSAGSGGAPTVRVTVRPAKGEWKPEAKNGEFPEPFDALKRTVSLPREKIVATNLPGNGQPWWLTLPREKHNIGPEPQPANAVMLPCVGPRYETLDKAKEHAALIAALRARNIIRQKTTMPLVHLGENRKVNRSNLRSGYDFWMVGYMYAQDILTPQWVMDLPDNQWYVETLQMPDGKTMYRAGVLAIVPYARMDEVYQQSLAGEEKWYRQAATRESNPQKKQELLGFAELYKAAPAEAKVDWQAP